jgi:NADH-ubiquinone oxidoreductase chain 5
MLDLSLWFTFKFEMDFFAIIFLVSLSVITITVGWFGELYVGGDSQKPVFWLTLLGFVVGIGILISRRDFLLLIIGWEVLGITSYLLVAGYLSSLSRNGAIKTVLFNRIGDVFFVLAFSLLIVKRSYLFFFLVVGFAICKSAQFPFSAWLPAAIAAPTPVSALVHSSTLVTAGLWILLKLEVGGLVLLVLGRRTMLVGALCALGERDLKKVVAFSTLSQLGLLIIAIASFSFQTGFFHLITHAFFKSILFIRIGYSILASSHNQQGIRIGTSSLRILIIAWVRLLRISGGLFFAGFFSKHAVLAQALVRREPVVFSVILVLGRIITCLYSVRLASSLLKLNKVRIIRPTQLVLITCCLFGGGLVTKILPFESQFTSWAAGFLSFLFLVWGYWAWVLLGEREIVSRIFFSSLVSTKSSIFSVAPRLLDEKVFSVRSLVRGLVDVDGAKLVGIFFLVFGWGLFLL